MFWPNPSPCSFSTKNPKTSPLISMLAMKRWSNCLKSPAKSKSRLGAPGGNWPQTMLTSLILRSKRKKSKSEEASHWPSMNSVPFSRHRSMHRRWSSRTIASRMRMGTMSVWVSGWQPTLRKRRMRMVTRIWTSDEVVYGDGDQGMTDNRFLFHLL